MLDTVGYDEGEPIGSWTMPKNRKDTLFGDARSDQANLQASATSSSLGGSLLPSTD
jgi:hypothetical protein